MKRKPTRTVSISLSDRGQTTQDFAVGIGLFLLAIAFAFSYLPTLITPFSTPVGGADTAQADRIAATLVDEFATGEGTNEIEDNLGELEDEDLGLRSVDGIAVDEVWITIYSLEESEEDPDIRSYGIEPEERQATSSASRLVMVEDKECNPACRLTVTVW